MKESFEIFFQEMDYGDEMLWRHVLVCLMDHSWGDREQKVFCCDHEILSRVFDQLGFNNPLVTSFLF